MLKRPCDSYLLLLLLYQDDTTDIGKKKAEEGTVYEKMKVGKKERKKTLARPSLCW